jgi:DNA-binding NarL/FixJ family response regulator
MDSPEKQIEMVGRWYTAYGRDRDVEMMCSLAHPDIEIVPESPLLSKLPGAAFSGLEGLRSLAEWSYTNYPRLRLETWEAEHYRGFVVASATFIVDDVPIPIVKRHTDTLFDIADGLIRRSRSFLQRADALAAAEASSKLTPREREIFQLLAAGMNAPQIAERLFLSPATVRTHVQNGVARLGAKTRVQAVSLALKRGEIRV